MNRTVSTLTAAGAGLGLALATTSAKAFVPLALAAIIGGAAVGGAALGGATTNPYYYPYYPYSTYVAPSPPVAVATAPTVAVGSRVCHFAPRWIDGVRERVRVCHTVVP